ncbi:MAG: AMP-binding protein [Acidimicrobiia bacterium]|nr:AMP-binding protein [Acidimicrobiia bacterium]
MVADGFVPWPTHLADEYRAKGYWAGNSLYAEVMDALRSRSEGIVLVDERRRYSRDELVGAVEARAAGLAEAGLGPEDRVVVQLLNDADFVITFLALLAVGSRPVLALPGHRRAELCHVAELSGATAIAVPSAPGGDVMYAELAAEVRSLVPSLLLTLIDGHLVDGHDIDRPGVNHRPPAVDPDDIALFLLSGGTTGLPKLIPRTHNDYAYNVRASSELCGFGPETVYLVALPAGHNFPLGCPGFLGTFLRGGRVVMSTSPASGRAFPLIKDEGVTTVAAVPAVAIQWMEDAAADPSALATLTLLQVGGAKLNPEGAKRIEPELGCRLQQVFGMAEGLLNYTREDDPIDVVIDTQGRPMSPGDEIRIVDSAGEPVPDGDVGELLTAGPYTLRGYYRAPEHNERSFSPDGFYRSGDLVRKHSSGNLIVEGRAKDHINRGGEKISAEEVEDHALAHPAIHNAAAVGVTDQKLGERIGLFAVANHPVDLDTLRQHFQERGVAAFKCPELLFVVDDLPVTNVGKIDKVALRRQADQHQAGRQGST